MASLQELKHVVRETLESRGVLDQLKAQVRAQVYKALDDPTEERPPLNKENLILNELIQEYLEFNGYKYTMSVLNAETGHTTAHRLDRQFLAQELNIVESRSSASVPLLYSIVGHFADKTKSREFAQPRSTLDSDVTNNLEFASRR